MNEASPGSPIVRYDDATSHIAQIVRPHLRNPQIFDRLAYAGHQFEIASSAEAFIGRFGVETSNACTHAGFYGQPFQLRTTFRPDRLTAEVAVHELGHAFDWYCGVRYMNLRPTDAESGYLSEHSTLWLRLSNILMFGRIADDRLPELAQAQGYGELFAEWFFICQRLSPGYEHFNITTRAQLGREMTLLVNSALNDPPWRMPAPALGSTEQHQDSQ